MMKTYFVFLLFLVLRGYPIAGASPTALIKTAGILLNGRGENFVQKAFSEFASVAVSFLRDLLTDGVFNSFGNSNDATFKEIFYSLENIIKLQKEILTEVKKLSITLSSIPQNVIIANNEQNIQNCVDSYKLLLQNRDSEIYMNQVKKCESIHTDVRSISRMLKTETIRNKFGYCNGQAMVKYLEYLFYLQFEGYSILLVSHQIQGKNESQTYINEYKNDLEDINQAIKNEFTTCANDTCKAVPLKIKQISESESEDYDQKILDILNKTFPWYGFYLFRLKSGSTYTLQDIKSKIGEFVNKTEKDDVVCLYVDLVNSKNDFIRSDIDLNSYIWNVSSKVSRCEHVKIGIKNDQLISKAGEKIYLSDRLADDTIYIIESPVLECPGPTRGINDCSSKPISYATSIHINTLQIAMTSVCYVIFIALLM